MGRRRRRRRQEHPDHDLCILTGKVVYDTRGEAEAELVEILARPGVIDQLWKPSEVTDCMACAGFHLTGHQARASGNRRRRREHSGYVGRIPAARKRATDEVDRALRLPERHPDAGWTSGFTDTTPGGMCHNPILPADMLDRIHADNRGGPAAL